MKEGIVIKALSGMYDVKCNDKLVRCILRPEIRIEDAKMREENKEMPLADLVSTGDRVNISVTDGEMGYIEEILPRKNQFGRSRIGKFPQVIVANLDVLLIIFSAKKPSLNLRMLDRFLVTAEASDMESVVCINKIDLEKTYKIESKIKVYEELYPVIYTSAITKEGIDELRDAMKDKVSAVLGPSGVGKPTLLNIIQPGLKLNTSNVSESTEKGRHTTTEVELLPLDFGRFVADTPGIKTLGLFEVPLEYLDSFFPEMREYLVRCKFSNCSHTHESDCAVKDAVKAGKINKKRYESYLRLLGEKDGNYPLRRFLENI